MATTRLEELEKGFQLLKQVQTLEGEARQVMEQEVLKALQVGSAASDEPLPHHPPAQATQPRKTVPTKAETVAPSSTSNEIYELVRVLGTRDKPVSATDLEGMIEHLAPKQMANGLGYLYSINRLCRVKVTDQDRAGATRILYKYYVPTETAG